MDYSPKTATTHYKIISIIVFICAALFASLFVFHQNNKPKKVLTSSDGVSLFSVARDLKPFELQDHHKNIFSEKQLRDHWTLIFFGFTHCSDVCPITLDMLKHSYNDLKKITPNIQIVFVSLDPERDSTQTISQYMQQYNPEFIGTTAKLSDLRKLQSQFGIYSERDQIKSNHDYQIKHSSSIILVNNQGKWAGLFKFGMNSKQFIEAYQESIKSL